MVPWNAKCYTLTNNIMIILLKVTEKSEFYKKKFFFKFCIVILGYIKSLECTFKHDEDRDNSTFGDIELRWDTQGERSDVISHIKQFNVIWSNTEERQVQTKVVTPDARKSLIPVTRLK